MVALIIGATAVSCSPASRICVASTLPTLGVVARYAAPAERCSGRNGIGPLEEGQYAFDARSDGVNLMSSAAHTSQTVHGSVWKTWSEMGCRG